MVGHVGGFIERYVGRVRSHRVDGGESGRTVRLDCMLGGVAGVSVVDTEAPAWVGRPVAQAAPVAAVTAQPRNARPDRVQVGDRQDGGQLTARRTDTVRRGDRVVVNAAEMTGIQIDLSVEDFRRFCLAGLALTGDLSR
ncbi:MAG: hypothetical protein QOC94_1146 [Actinoplanes sp.]|jgi:hypothetical protein|nr:hypothetical protein [Actinoplanes sp.]